MKIKEHLEQPPKLKMLARRTSRLATGKDCFLSSDVAYRSLLSAKGVPLLGTKWVWVKPCKVSVSSCTSATAGRRLLFVPEVLVSFGIVNSSVLLTWYVIYDFCSIGLA